MSMKDRLLTKILTDVLEFQNLSITKEKMEMLSVFIKSDVPTVVYRKDGRLYLLTDFIISMEDDGLIIDPLGNEKVYDFIQHQGTLYDAFGCESITDDAIETAVLLQIPFNSLVSRIHDAPEYYEEFCENKFELIEQFVLFFNPTELPERKLDPVEKIIKEFLNDDDS